MKGIFLVMVLMITFGCGGQQNEKRADEAEVRTVAGDRVEVIYFHGKQRCTTCRSIEERTREVLAENFEEAIKAGKLIFRVVDISDKEGEKVADRYEVTWSSLFINHWKDGKEQRNNMTEFAFARAVNNAAEFKEGIKAKIGEFIK